MKYKMPLAAAILAALSGCAFHHPQSQQKMLAPIQADSHGPLVRIVDGGNGKYYASVDQEPIILVKKTIDENFDALATVGQARRNERGGTEAKVNWQLPANSQYIFTDSKDTDLPEIHRIPGIKVVSISAPTDLPHQTKALAAIEDPVKECGRTDTRQFFCWVNVERSVEFKYSINLFSSSNPVILLDPTVVIRGAQ
jgi:hypothetical protein